MVITPTLNVPTTAINYFPIFVLHEDKHRREQFAQHVFMPHKQKLKVSVTTKARVFFLTRQPSNARDQRLSDFESDRLHIKRVTIAYSSVGEGLWT